MNKPLQVSESNFSASFAKICKINLLTRQSNNNCFEIINIHMNKFLLINNITGSATVMSHSQKQIITKSVGHPTTGVFQTHCDNQFLQTKRTQRDSATSARSHKHNRQHLSVDYDVRHASNEVTSDDALKSSFDGHHVKFEVRAFKHDTSDKTKHQKLKSNIEFNIKWSYFESFSQVHVNSSSSVYQD